MDPPEFQKRLPRPGEGRPPALTPDVGTTIVRALKMGCTIECAAALGGVGRSTAFAWLRRGAHEESGPYFELWVQARAAIAHAEATNVALISVAARKDWRAASWLLERRNPASWGRVPEAAIDVEAAETMEAPGTEDAGGPIEFQGLTHWEIADVARTILRNRRARLEADPSN